MKSDLINFDEEGKQLSRLQCYAESDDGVHWKKPNLGLIEFDGSKNNNIIAPMTPGTAINGMSAWRPAGTESSGGVPLRQSAGRSFVSARMVLNRPANLFDCALLCGR